MAGSGKMFMTLLLVVFAVAFGWKSAAAQVHHVVGDDRGWEPSTDLVSWFSSRVFKVGDTIWFAYSAAQERIVELETIEEFHSCDLAKPIKMYSDGLDKVPLDREGTRYFASGNVESCKKGLKLPVEVQPQAPQPKNKTVGIGLAAGPTAPSASTRVTGLSYTTVLTLVLCSLGL